MANSKKSKEQRLYHLRMQTQTFEMMNSEVEQTCGTPKQESISQTINDETALSDNVAGSNIGTVIPSLKQCYRSSVVAEVFDMHRTKVQALYKAKELIGFQPNGRNRYYPMFQFSETGPIDGLGKVLKALDCNDENAISFMRTPNAELDWNLPIDMLKEGNIHDVVSAAKEYKLHVLNESV